MASMDPENLELVIDMGEAAFVLVCQNSGHARVFGTADRDYVAKALRDAADQFTTATMQQLQPDDVDGL